MTLNWLSFNFQWFFIIASNFVSCRLREVKMHLFKSWVLMHAIINELIKEVDWVNRVYWIFHENVRSILWWADQEEQPKFHLGHSAIVGARNTIMISLYGPGIVWRRKASNCRWLQMPVCISCSILRSSYKSVSVQQIVFIKRSKILTRLFSIDGYVDIIL